MKDRVRGQNVFALLLASSFYFWLHFFSLQNMCVTNTVSLGNLTWYSDPLSSAQHDKALEAQAKIKNLRTLAQFFIRDRVQKRSWYKREMFWVCFDRVQFITLWKNTIGFGETAHFQKLEVKDQSGRAKVFRCYFSPEPLEL